MTQLFIVDDNQFYTSILAARLSEIQDCTVEKYHSGKSCINNAHKQPQIIFLDHNLGDTSGFEVLKEIKSTYPNIHIVMLSGQKKMEVAIKSLRYGATDYLIKGSDDSLEKIKQIIQDCKQISNARKKISKKNVFQLFLGL